jgi:hypothetical protein
MRGKPIQVGDVVLFRLYNKPEHKFYGNVRRGTITRIEQTLTRGVKIYWIDTPVEYEPYNLHSMWIYRKEIKKVL